MLTTLVHLFIKISSSEVTWMAYIPTRWSLCGPESADPSWHTLETEFETCSKKAQLVQFKISSHHVTDYEDKFAKSAGSFADEKTSLFQTQGDLVFELFELVPNEFHNSFQSILAANRKFY